MKKNILYLLFFISGLGLSQNSEKVFSDAAMKSQEGIFIHYNSSFLMPGESLLYTLYNLNKNKRQLSELSKIAKVKLMDSHGNLVLDHSLHLENGVGYSDFLIPSELPTGVYTLIGYTDWMANFNYEGAFEQKLIILNPYTDKSDELVEFVQTGNFEIADNNSNDSNSAISIDFDKEFYSSREKVTMQLQSNQNLLEGSAISVSVRRIDSVTNFNPASTKEMNITLSDNFNYKKLPEARGRNIQGSIVGKQEKNKSRIAYFVPGKPENFRIIETDTDGNFRFQVSEKIDYETAYIKPVANGEEIYEFKISSEDDSFSVEPTSKIQIPASKKEFLKRKAVHNQIQQSYKNVFADSIMIQLNTAPFFGEKGISFDLDDYTRFETMKETFTEVIQFASFKRNGDDHYVDIYGLNSQTNFGAKPLILINGIPVFDHNFLYDFDPAKVKTIEIVRDKYFLGPEVFQGVVNVTTVSDISIPELNKTYQLKIPPAEAEKMYFQPDYSGNKTDFSRVPDYRYQLFWDPSLSGNTIEFYTSDITGTFEVRVEGFLENGESVSLIETFRVQ